MVQNTEGQLIIQCASSVLLFIYGYYLPAKVVGTVAIYWMRKLFKSMRSNPALNDGCIFAAGALHKKKFKKCIILELDETTNINSLKISKPA